MKQFARRVVVAVLSWQVNRLRRKNTFKIIGVVGSIGKTSTKLAIAEVLSSKQKIQYQTGNYNDLTTVPLIFFGHTTPSLFNPFAWLKIFVSNEFKLKRSYPYDIVVVELGTDGPGQIPAFSRYLRLDIAIITALTPEHMEYFDSLDAVATEEMSVAAYADKVVINVDYADRKYLDQLTNPVSYGIVNQANYQATDITYGAQTKFSIQKKGQHYTDQTARVFSSAQMYSLLAAATVWDLLGNPVSELSEGIANITDVPGRMQILQGIRGVTIIDDSYNASPEAMKAALDTVYRMPTEHKIVLLGNMNELGEFGIEAHKQIGEYCDPTKLDEVITLGPEANQYLAPAARAKGCKVTEFDSPYVVGDYLASALPDSALVLIKGSQNRVFAEEAIKAILLNPNDEEKLVRQSKEWIKLKQKQFNA